MADGKKDPIILDKDGIEIDHVEDDSEGYYEAKAKHEAHAWLLENMRPGESFDVIVVSSRLMPEYWIAYVKIDLGDRVLCEIKYDRIGDKSEFYVYQRSH